jgi:hypothetical protein
MHVKRSDLNTKSRVMGDYHARIRKRPGVKSTWSTRQRIMKPICLGRNNYLFLGPEKSARHASLIYSLIETCKMNAVKPVKSLERVFNEIASGATNYEALLPMHLVKQQYKINTSLTGKYKFELIFSS